MKQTRNSIASVLTIIIAASLLAAFCRQASAKAPGLAVDVPVKSLETGQQGRLGPIRESGVPLVPNSLEAPSPTSVQAGMILTHGRNQKRLQGQSLSGGNHCGAGANTMDVHVDGDSVLDVAVIVDNGNIIVPAMPANPIDLMPGMRIRYTPTDTNTYLVELSTDQELDPNSGPDLELGDDEFAEVALTAPFPFLGIDYNSVFVGSDGHITLGAGDGTSNPRDAARHIGGPPRLSPLLTDLDPTCRGSVHADVRTDRVVVTWNDVVHFERGNADGCDPEVPGNTVQAILCVDGMIDFIFGELDTAVISQPAPNREAVTGIAEGNAEGPLHEIDMTEDLPLDLEAGAIFEQFSGATPETFDLVQLSQEFYETHEDKYDYLVMFTDFEIFAGGTAFHAGIKNQTLGLGLPTFDFSGLLGSAGELESFLFMNNINLWFGNTADDYTNPPVHRFAVTTTPRLTGFLGGPVTPTTAPYELVGMVDITGNGNSPEKLDVVHWQARVVHVVHFDGLATGSFAFAQPPGPDTATSGVVSDEVEPTAVG